MIGGDIIPAMKEMPEKSMRQIYPITLTDRHRGTEVQILALKGPNIDRQNLSTRVT